MIMPYLMASLAVQISNKQRRESSRSNTGEDWYKKTDYRLSRNVAAPMDTMGPQLSGPTWTCW
jgi:hypothetical protein